MADSQPAGDEEHDIARAYCTEFVSARLARGSSPADVLREFCVSGDAWPAQAESLGAEALAMVVLEWVAACREREAIAAAFARAEYVEVTPAFADCTGRYVDVHFGGNTDDV